MMRQLVEKPCASPAWQGSAAMEALEGRRLLDGAGPGGAPAGVPAATAEAPVAADAGQPAAAPAGAAVVGGLEGDVRGGGGSPVMAQEDGVYYHFTGGPGIQMRRSVDIVRWDKIGQAFPGGLPAWAEQEYPDVGGLWAPDIARFNGKWHLYYSVSSLGSQRSSIGVATNTTLDPDDPAYRWVDQGEVIRSRVGDDFNAIDQNIVLDEDGTPWIAYGSYWTGIKMRRLDPATGKLSAQDATTYELARRTPQRDGTRAVEAPFVVRHDGWYYLFVSFDPQPTEYNVRVGRSRSVTGPYLDMDGTPMMRGGGTVVLQGYGHVTAPGHNGVMLDDPNTGKDWFVHHYKDARYNGARVQMVRELVWGPDGWPVVGEPQSREQLTPLPQPVTVGTWQHSVNFNDANPLRLLSDGHINTPDSAATWALDGDQLTLRWPNLNAPGGAYVDQVTVADNGRWYVGRTKGGLVVRGTRTVDDLVPPRVLISRFSFEGDQSIRIFFSEDVAGTLGPADLQVRNLDDGTAIDSASILLKDYDPATRVATFGFAGVLPDGNYQATVPAAGVEDATGNPLAEDATLDFFVLAGDANRDRAVTIADFALLRAGFGGPGLFSDGDFNYDGQVTIADFAILRGNFGTSLAAPAASLFADGEESLLPS